MNSDHKALWQLAAALTLSSLTALFAKIVTLPVHQIIFGRSLVAALALWVFLRWRGMPVLLGGRKETLFFLGSGCLLGGHWVTYFLAIKLSTVAVGMVALYTYPIITIILEPFFDRKRHHLLDFAIGIVVFGGVWWMAPEWDWDNDVSRGIVFGVLSAAIYSVRNILIRRHVKNHAAPTVMFYQVLGTALMLLPALFWQAGKFDAGEVPEVLVLGVVFTAVHHTLFAAVLRRFSVKTVSILSSVQPAMGAGFALVLLGEGLEWRTVAGGIVVIGAAVFETARSIRRPATPAR